jgi:glycine/D-amino acid oxidase-like deaminating enzyme/nitrite reductase/ring-hydroxylating ferredoxin subunit
MRSLCVNTTPYWLDTAKIRTFPALGEDIRVDVLIVGGGITGLTTAYLLKEAGLTVAVAERDQLAMVDTGHTTAHLTHVTDLRFHQMAKNFGKDHAQAAWDAGAAAIDQIEELVRKERIECEFTRVPGYLHAPVSGGTKDERESFREDAALAIELGFDAAYLDSVPKMQMPGVRFANQAKFHPRKYLASLAAAIPGKGSHVFEETAIATFDADKHRARANGHWINYGRVVLATHNPLVGEAGIAGATLFQTKLALYTSYVIGAKLPRGGVPIASFWDTNDPYNYLRVDRHADFDYAIFGGEDHKTGQAANTETCFQRLEDSLKELLPNAEIDHRWSGQVIETTDGLPFIGENAEGQFLGTGFSGNGMTYGTVTAMMARDWATGAKNPWAELFDVDRKKIKGGAWDYLRENKDYPYYLIKSRFADPEAESVHGLQPGEGRIVKSKSGKIAAYRDADGTVRKHSAVCTHMGCIVRWNQAEGTWDCPCHGSRFDPFGKVISGPAETPLASV